MEKTQTASRLASPQTQMHPQPFSGVLRPQATVLALHGVARDAQAQAEATIAEEFRRTEEVVLSITGQSEILDNEQWLRNLFHEEENLYIGKIFEETKARPAFIRRNLIVHGEIRVLAPGNES